MIIEKEANRVVIYSTEKAVLAECDFTRRNEGVTITRTIVDESLRGQGIAGKLVEAVKAIAKEENLPLDATCSYAIRYLATH